MTDFEAESEAIWKGKYYTGGTRNERRHQSLKIHPNQRMYRAE